MNARKKQAENQAAFQLGKSIALVAMGEIVLPEILEKIMLPDFPVDVGTDAGSSASVIAMTKHRDTVFRIAPIHENFASRRTFKPLSAQRAAADKDLTAAITHLKSLLSNRLNIPPTKEKSRGSIHKRPDELLRSIYKSGVRYGMPSSEKKIYATTYTENKKTFYTLAEDGGSDKKSTFYHVPLMVKCILSQKEGMKGVWDHWANGSSESTIVDLASPCNDYQAVLSKDWGFKLSYKKKLFQKEADPSMFPLYEKAFAEALRGEVSRLFQTFNTSVISQESQAEVSMDPVTVKMIESHTKEALKPLNLNYQLPSNYSCYSDPLFSFMGRPVDVYEAFRTSYLSETPVPLTFCVRDATSRGYFQRTITIDKGVITKGITVKVGGSSLRLQPWYLNFAFLPCVMEQGRIQFSGHYGEIPLPKESALIAFVDDVDQDFQNKFCPEVMRKLLSDECKAFLPDEARTDFLHMILTQQFWKSYTQVIFGNAQQEDLEGPVQYAHLSYPLKWELCFSPEGVKFNKFVGKSDYNDKTFPATKCLSELVEKYLEICYKYDSTPGARNDCTCYGQGEQGFSGLLKKVLSLIEYKFIF
eukprot:GHVP01024120.1.p1 GENE.GHVP01024120.1~~GHVP01024120.1.p1  ORF type:complete len:594 (+),score=93.61 GHVP01024120.1:22-1782(+)